MERSVLAASRMLVSTRMARRALRGFTLVELMVVVMLVGILATIGVMVFREHIFHSRTVEALGMMQSIRAAEERWRAETLSYFDASCTSGTPPCTAVTDGQLYPMTAPSDQKYAWEQPGHADFAKWRLLNPTTSGPVLFGYRVFAGGARTAMTSPANVTGFPGWPTPNDPWYVIEARGDTDADGRVAIYLGSSLNGVVYRENEGE